VKTRAQRSFLRQSPGLRADVLFSSRRMSSRAAHGGGAYEMSLWHYHPFDPDAAHHDGVRTVSHDLTGRGARDAYGAIQR
jgi:hypothetical protein